MYEEDENKLGTRTREDCEPNPAWDVVTLCTLLLYPNVPYTDVKVWRNKCNNRKAALASSGVLKEWRYLKLFFINLKP